MSEKIEFDTNLAFEFRILLIDLVVQTLTSYCIDEGRLEFQQPLQVFIRLEAELNAAKQKIKKQAKKEEEVETLKTMMEES